jgi:hypothetical protein
MSVGSQSKRTVSTSVLPQCYLQPFGAACLSLSALLSFHGQSKTHVFPA